MNATCAENAHVQIEENRQVKRNIKLYNLDMILTVGCHVKSPNGIIFRKWTTPIIKDCMLKGYVINQKRLETLNRVVKIQVIE